MAKKAKKDKGSVGADGDKPQLPGKDLIQADGDEAEIKDPKVPVPANKDPKRQAKVRCTAPTHFGGRLKSGLSDPLAQGCECGIAHALCCQL